MINTYPNIIYSPLQLCTYSPECLGMKLPIIVGVGGSGTWPTANKALYLPFVLMTPWIVTHLFTANGASAANNFDIGIYSAPGKNKIVSTGSTAQSGTTTLQIVAVTNTYLLPGNYLLALVFNGTSGTMYRYTPSAANCDFMGIQEETSAFALPATATPVTPTSGYVPLFGVVGYGY